jgi:hypothetical protein
VVDILHYWLFRTPSLSHAHISCLD